MDKTIEQNKVEAAQKWVNDYKSIHCRTFAFNSHLAGFDTGFRAGYLKAVEVLNSREASKHNEECNFEVSLSDWSDFLESKIDEVLGG